MITSAVLILSGCAHHVKEPPGAKPGIVKSPFPSEKEGYEHGNAIEGIISDLPLFKLERPRKMIAVQVLLFDCRSLEEVEEEIIALKEAGFNTVIFRVFQNKGDRFYAFSGRNSDTGVYFGTDHAPVVDDILGDIADISHRNGMDIFAWMTTRYADYGVEDLPGWRAARYDLQSGGITEAKGLNLFKGEVRDHIRALYRDLADYDIDGILFQDDLVLRHTEGFSREAREGFAAFYGSWPGPERFYLGVHEGKDGEYRVSSYGEDFWAWSRWKNGRLLGVAGEIMEEVRLVRPDMKFAINLMYEAVLSPKDALAWLSQDIDNAVRVGFDYYAIMAYHRQMSSELDIKGDQLEETMAGLAERSLQIVGDPDRTLIKLQIMDWRSEEVLPFEEVDRILRIVKEKGVSSLAFVPYKREFDFEKMSELLAPPEITHTKTAQAPLNISEVPF